MIGGKKRLTLGSVIMWLRGGPTFHPGAAPGGPDLHPIAGGREIQLFSGSESEIKKDEVHDTWYDSQASRLDRRSFSKLLTRILPFPTPRSTALWFSFRTWRAKPDRSSSTTTRPWPKVVSRQKQTTVAVWKSLKLKRNVVDSVAAEGQALRIGAVHRHRRHFLEAFHGNMSAEAKPRSFPSWRLLIRRAFMMLRISCRLPQPTSAINDSHRSCRN